MKRNRRIQPRESMEIPILYARGYENIYHEALTRDISAQGLSFNANQKFFNGDCFLIKPMEAIPGGEPPPGNTWAAQVQWCVKNPRDDGYKVGIKRIPAWELTEEKDPASCELQCELCGTRLIENVIDTHCGVTLCSDCFTDCYKDAGQQMQKTMARFMAGNVI